MRIVILEPHAKKWIATFWINMRRHKKLEQNDDLRKSHFALVAMAALALGLSGCVNVLPKTKPAQLYRFTFVPDAPAAAPVAAPAPVSLSLAPIQFPQDSSGDRVTTIEDNQVSYVAQARWTAPASTLFNEAVSDGFARRATMVRLDTRGSSLAPFRLDIIVRKFETDYSGSRPVVGIDLDARLVRMSDRAVVGQKFITENVELRHNNMDTMVGAYNQATTAAINDLITFSEATLAPLAEPATPMTQVPDTGQKAEGL